MPLCIRDGVVRGAECNCERREALCSCPLMPWFHKVPFLVWPLAQCFAVSPLGWEREGRADPEPVLWEKKEGRLCRQALRRTVSSHEEEAEPAGPWAVAR